MDVHRKTAPETVDRAAFEYLVPVVPIYFSENCFIANPSARLNGKIDVESGRVSVLIGTIYGR